MYDNLANIKNIARMNGNIIKAKEPASRYPTSTSTITSTSTSTASTYVDPGGNLNVLNRSGLYRKNITSKCNDACDLTRYSSKCDNYFIVPDSFELLKDFNLSESHTNNHNSNNSNGYNSNNSNYNSSNSNNHFQLSQNGATPQHRRCPAQPIFRTTLARARRHPASRDLSPAPPADELRAPHRRLVRRAN